MGAGLPPDLHRDRVDTIETRRGSLLPCAVGGEADIPGADRRTIDDSDDDRRVVLVGLPGVSMVIDSPRDIVAGDPVVIEREVTDNGADAPR